MSQPLLPKYSLSRGGSPLQGQASDIIYWGGGRGIAMPIGTLLSSEVIIQARPIDSSDSTEWETLSNGVFASQDSSGTVAYPKAARVLDIPAPCQLRAVHNDIGTAAGTSGIGSDSILIELFTGTPSTFFGFFSAVDLDEDSWELIGTIHADTLNAAIVNIKAWCDGGVPTALTLLLALTYHVDTNPSGGDALSLQKLNEFDGTSADIKMWDGTGETQVAFAESKIKSIQPFHPQGSANIERFEQRIYPIEANDTIAVWVKAQENINNCRVFAQVEQYLTATG